MHLRSLYVLTILTKTPKFPKPDNLPQSPTSPTPPAILDFDDVEEDEKQVAQTEQMEMRADMNLQEVIVNASPIAMRTRVSESKSDKKSVAYAPQAQAKIILTEIKQDADYMKNLSGIPAEDYKAYLKLRETYGGTPTFYFDMANWFMSKGDKRKALSVLTSVAELNIENAGLFRLLAYRLKEYKEYNLEVYICKKVVDWRPMEPQSYRDYALALEDAGDYQKALDVLYSAITQSFASSVQNISRGIDEVLVTELNKLIELHSAQIKTDSIDKDLIHAIPVDIRVVINWNMPNTDIDLHVSDPLGAICFFGLRRTEAGGRISNDITQGLGPEHFMLKKAIKGKYKISVNYFGDSQVKADGPATIMAEIYTSYSNKLQKREVVCLQLSKESKGEVKIAEFEF